MPNGICLARPLVAVVATLLVLAGCTTSAPDSVATSYCEIALPMTFVASDDDETKRQIEQHNATYMWVCEGIRIDLNAPAPPRA